MKMKPFQIKIEILKFISVNKFVTQADILEKCAVNIKQSALSVNLSELYEMGFIDYYFKSCKKVYFSTGFMERIFNEND